MAFSTLVRRFQNQNCDHPYRVLLAVLVISLFFAWQIPQLSFKTSIYDLVIEDLPETRRYEAFKQDFGSEEIIRLVIKGDDIFSPQTFDYLTQLNGELSKIDGVRRVISLPDIRAAVDRGNKLSLPQLAELLTPVRLFTNNLFAENHKSTAMTLVLKNEADRDLVITAVRGLISQAPTALTLYQIGMPLVSEALAVFTQRDFFRLPPITLVLIALILLIVFRRPTYLLLPLATVMLALVWTFGMMALLGVHLSILTMIVPVFLIAVGTAYCLHIVSACIEHTHPDHTRRQIITGAFDQIRFPTVLAVGTTIVGLGSLMISRITAICEFALFTCLGMISLLIIALTFFPAVLMVIGPGRAKPPGSKLIAALLSRIATLNLNHQKIVLPLIGLLVVFCLLGIFRVQVQTNPVGFFRPEAPVSRHFHDIYTHLSGSFPMNVILAGGEDDYFEDPEHIAQIATLQRFAETLPGVDKSVSFADYMMLVNYALNRFDPAHYRLPTEGFEVRMILNNFKLMLGEDMFNRFMNNTRSKTNVLLLTHSSNSREFLDNRDRIMAFARDTLPAGLRAEVSGFGLVVSVGSHLLTGGQIKSFGLTMVVIFGIMLLLFLSAKVGAIAVIPNLFPIVVNFGVMGWLGIELSMFTALIASIAIGLAVDDTIHYMVRYNNEFRRDLDDRRALKAAVMHVGQPIILTTGTISIGFAVLAFSAFKPTAVFGLLMVLTMASALIGDLILLPSLMRHVEIITLWDLVQFKLGKEPGEGIPLFKGLSRAQVHAVLMARPLKYFDAGTVLFRKGDFSDSMYAVISGELDVIDHPIGADPISDTSAKRVATLKSGEILGEMGLLRSAPRSASVVAVQAGELLQINWKMIDRLHWLFPPTARKFSHNLMVILSDRIERLTTCLTEESRWDDASGMCQPHRFEAALDHAIGRAAQQSSEFALCLLQTQIGTTAGDDPPAVETMLSRLEDALGRQIRKMDTAARLDDDTFAVLMPQTAVESADELISHLKRSLERDSQGDEPLQLHLRHAIVGPRPSKTTTAAALLALARKKLV